MSEPAYHRILLKLSGEALMGESDFGIDPAILERLAGDVRHARELRRQFVPAGRDARPVLREGRHSAAVVGR